MEEAADGGTEVVESPGNDDVVVEPDTDGDHEHGESDPYRGTDGKERRRRRVRLGQHRYTCAKNGRRKKNLRKNCDLGDKNENNGIIVIIDMIETKTGKR